MCKISLQFACLLVSIDLLRQNDNIKVWVHKTALTRLAALGGAQCGGAAGRAELAEGGPDLPAGGGHQLGRSGGPADLQLPGQLPAALQAI